MLGLAITVSLLAAFGTLVFEDGATHHLAETGVSARDDLVVCGIGSGGSQRTRISLTGLAEAYDVELRPGGHREPPEDDATAQGDEVIESAVHVAGGRALDDADLSESRLIFRAVGLPQNSFSLIFVGKLLTPGTTASRDIFTGRVVDPGRVRRNKMSQHPRGGAGLCPFPWNLET